MDGGWREVLIWLAVFDVLTAACGYPCLDFTWHVHIHLSCVAFLVLGESDNGIRYV